MAAFGGYIGYQALSSHTQCHYNSFSRVPLRSRMSPQTQTSMSRISEDEKPHRSICTSPPQISPQYLQIWEHACLLFHSLDLGSALRLFGSLEPQTTCSHIMTILMLNIGIILCQLGDYTRARTMLARAADCWDTFPMAFFLLGISAFEIGHYLPAQKAFNSATSAFERANILALGHNAVGLHFVLTAQHAKDNELSSAYASTLENKIGREYPTLHRFPAGLIFENPLAPLIHAACAFERMRFQAGSLPWESESKMISTAISCSERSRATPRTSSSATVFCKKATFLPEELYPLMRISPTADDSFSAETSSPVKISPPVTTSSATTIPAWDTYASLRKPSADESHSNATCAGRTYHSRPVITKNPLLHKAKSFVERVQLRRGKSEDSRRGLHSVSEVLGLSITTPCLGVTHEIPQRRKGAALRMVPRDAQVKHQPLCELSDAIKHTGPPGSSELLKADAVAQVDEPSQKPRMRYVPRDARPEHDTSSELASFFQNSGPGEIHPINIDKRPRVKRVNTYPSGRANTDNGTLAFTHDRLRQQSILLQSSYDLLQQTPDSRENKRSSSMYSRPVDVSRPWEHNDRRDFDTPDSHAGNIPIYIDIHGLVMANAAPRRDSFMEADTYVDSNATSSANAKSDTEHPVETQWPTRTTSIVAPVPIFPPRRTSTPQLVRLERAETLRILEGRE